MKKKIERTWEEKLCFRILGVIFLVPGLAICLISVPLMLVAIGFLTFIPGALLVVCGYALLKESKYKGGKNGNR